MIVDGIDINPQNGEAGTHTIEFKPVSINDDLDKTIIIDGICGDKTAPLTIIHYGQREVFSCADGDFELADGGTFNVLK